MKIRKFIARNLREILDVPVKIVSLSVVVWLAVQYLAPVYTNLVTVDLWHPVFAYLLLGTVLTLFFSAVSLLVRIVAIVFHFLLLQIPAIREIIETEDRDEQRQPPEVQSWDTLPVFTKKGETPF